MNQRKPRKRQKPAASSEAPKVSGSGSSSLFGALVMIAGVVGAVGIMSLVLLRSPTSQIDPTFRPTTNETASSNATAAAATPASSLPPLSEGERTEQSTASIRWIAQLPYSTHGSPRLVRNGNQSDVIIAYGDEVKKVGGAMAVDVHTGEPRWQIKSDDEMFTLPMPLEPFGKDEQPWVVGGRNGQLYCVDARNGDVIWKFQPSGNEGRSQGVFNFFTGRPFSDVDGDGVDDFLIPNGGDSKRNRFQSRPPGHLFLLSGSNGRLLHSMQVPDDAETYCSNLYWDRDGERLVVFGTGGETFPGSLWTVPMQSVARGTLDDARELVPQTDSKGAVAPPSFADLDRDGVLDLIAVPFDGRVVVISGRTQSTLWQYTPTGVHETQSSPAVADMDGDGDLDIAYVTQVGVFPRWTASHVRVFDGLSGEVLWEEQIQGNLSAASPLALDIDGDQRSELFYIDANPALFRPSMNERSISHLQMVHVDEGRKVDLGAVDGFNAGTGWIGDADEDGSLEWFIPLKMDGRVGRLVCVDLNMPAPAFIAWGGYLGTLHDGTYHDPDAKKLTSR